MATPTVIERGHANRHLHTSCPNLRGDPDPSGELRGQGRAGDEALGMGGVRGGQDLLPLPDHLRRAAEVNLLGGKQPYTAVAVTLSMFVKRRRRGG